MLLFVLSVKPVVVLSQVELVDIFQPYVPSNPVPVSLALTVALIILSLYVSDTVPVGSVSSAHTAYIVWLFELLTVVSDVIVLSDTLLPDENVPVPLFV